MSSSSNSQRRRSGIWDVDILALEQEGRRQRWTQERQRKQPTLYDEWLNEEREEASASATGTGGDTPTTDDEPASRPPIPRRASMPFRQGTNNTATTTPAAAAAAASTIRTVTPDLSQSESGTEKHTRAPGADNHQRKTTGLGRATSHKLLDSSFPASPLSTHKSKRLVKEKDSESRSSHVASAVKSSPSSRKDAGDASAIPERSSSRKRTQSTDVGSGGAASSGGSASRPRTRTLDERHRERSPSAKLIKGRNRLASVNSPSSPITAQAPESWTMPILKPSHTPSAASISSLGSPVQPPSDLAGRRSISPISSLAGDSAAMAVPSATARRMIQMVRMINGRMNGTVLLRRDPAEPWTETFCFIQDDVGSLMAETANTESGFQMLIPDLRSTTVTTQLDGDVFYLELLSPPPMQDVHVKLLSHTEFDNWYAAFLYWQQPSAIPSRSTSTHRPESGRGSRSGTPAEHSYWNSVADPRDRVPGERRRSTYGGALKEAPVIKIGKMIYWETGLGFGPSSVAAGNTSTARPANIRKPSLVTRRWRQISGQLRENGELKLHSDTDNALISVVQLSQLNRCAIQRLHTSVLDNDFCIAIYPQYTSTFASDQQLLNRPIFLGLEDRVLYEVWFVLLRAFTMPSLYGPRMPSVDEAENSESDAAQLETMLATTSTDMFRMERSLSVRIVEARIQRPIGTPVTEIPHNGGHGHGHGHGHGRSHHDHPTTEKHGYYAEILLDNETRGKTAVKYEGLNPFWGEGFEFNDLPPVLGSASVVIKRRPPEHAFPQERIESRLQHDIAMAGDQQGGYSQFSYDLTCGKVEIFLQELEDEKEVEKWWPVLNIHGQQVGEVLIKACAQEGVILMARDYQGLSDLLHQFASGLTLQIAQTIPGELKRISNTLLDIFQVSGKAGEWIMALVEDEIDGIHKETPITRLRYTSRAGSTDADPQGSAAPNSDRELIVRDLNKNATVEANLLFRGNTLLTKSLDSHMRRVGKEYLEESLAAKLQEINDKDPDCEVDPNRVGTHHDLDRNWRRLMAYTQEVWKSIVAAKASCPIELRLIFRHIRACAEDRYGDFLRSVTFSSVSGFLFLRFFCPAVLNPKMFGLLRDDIKPRARRTFTLMAKSLQTMANMASFGTKEPWMEPMNAFLVQHRESFKSFIEEVCYVPAPLSTAIWPVSPSSSPKILHVPGVVSAEQHLSYTTPMTIMQRLPPSSREGFPSLPYLIDQARAFADLIQLWLDATTALTHPGGAMASHGKSYSEVVAALRASDGDLLAFHEMCVSLSARTQECLNRAERAERPNSPPEVKWEELIDQLGITHAHNGSIPKNAFATLADKIASDPSVVSEDANPAIEATLAQLRAHETESSDERAVARPYEPTPPRSGSAFAFDPPRSVHRDWERPGSASIGGNNNGGGGGGGASTSSNVPGSLTRQQFPTPFPPTRGSGSPAPSAAPSISNVSSTVSSDTEHALGGPTALPNYERELRHRERREAARVQIQQQMEASRAREKDKEKEHKRVKALVPTLRKKRHDKDAAAAAAATSTPPPKDNSAYYTNYG